MILSLIAAKASNHVIGHRGRLPWSIPGDMKWFREKTIGKPCIMGRATWDSLPRKPLPERSNIVVTRNKAFQAPGAKVAHSLAEAMAIAEGEGAAEAMVIGGASLYGEALPKAKKLYITEILQPFPGDVFFPLFVQRRWAVTFREDHMDHDPPYVHFILERPA